MMRTSRPKKKSGKTEPDEELLVSEQRDISKERGGGTLKYAYYGYEDAKVNQTIMRYSIAWINRDIFSDDNGRVLGFDNAHNYDHRHLMGTIEAVEFSSFEDTFNRFQTEWQDLVQQHRSKNK